MTNRLTRREAVGAIGAIGGSLVVGDSATALKAFEAPRHRAASIKQSVARWCYAKIPLEELCAAAAGMGYVSVELLDPDEWAVAKRHGLACAMSNSFGSIPVGFNRPDHHDKLVADGEARIAAASAAGVTKIVIFSGNRAGLSDGDGIQNCITGIKRLMPAAERHGVTLCMEMLNSKVDHQDYHADHTAWAVQVVKGVNSPRFKLLYDIYHMQVMEGDVIATIRANRAHIAHFHTGGVPGRAEIDASQELNYPAIMRAIAELGYEGYVGQEFVPRRDPLTSLREAFAICDVG